jgi:Methyltransferase domain
MFLMTSDQFFSESRGLPLYDLIFIDGNHRELPALRDMAHAVECLAPKGTIVCHDIMPPETEGDWFQPGLCGEPWKAWAYLRMSRPDLRMAVLPIELGWGIIRHGQQELFIPDEKPYLPPSADPVVDKAFYLRYRDRLLNVIHPDDLLAWLKD